MRIRSHSLTTAAAVLQVLIAVVFPVGSLAAGTEGRIAIGLIAPLTGPLADAGETLKNSALLAREEFDPAGKIDLIIDDDTFNAQKAVTIAKRMIDVDKVSALIVFASGSALSVADIAERAKIPMIAIALSDKVTGDRRYVFRYFLTADTIAKTIQQEISRRGYSDISVVTSLQEGMISIRDALLALEHPPLITQDEVLPNETDFKTIALKITAAKAPVVVALTFGFQTAILGRALRANRYEGEIASGPQLQIPSVVKGADGALEGTWIATMDDSAGAEFFKKYKERYRNDPVPDGTYAYDAIRLLIHGAFSGNIVKYLEETPRFTGIFGDSALGAHHTYSVAATIKEIRGLEFEKMR